MKEGRGGGKEHEAPTHLIEISELTPAVRITKLQFRVYSQEKVSQWQCLSFKIYFSDVAKDKRNCYRVSDQSTDDSNSRTL